MTEQDHWLFGGKRRKGTGKLNEPIVLPDPEDIKAEPISEAATLKMSFTLVPISEKKRTFDPTLRPWRIMLVPIGITATWLALELHGDVMIGSNNDDSTDIDVNLSQYDGWMRGVSRRHVMLRPSKQKLFVMDLRSTNGTQINGLPLGIGWAYALKDNDMLSLGKLHLRVRLLQRP